jgi:hypothetical protein
MLQRRTLSDLVAVGAGPSARAVVLHRAVPARSGTGRRRNGGADGERERESQSDLAQHGHSPCVEARSGFYELDREMRRLFPRSHSNGVRSVQVFVCSVRCALHITVICLCDRSGERPDRPVINLAYWPVNHSHLLIFAAAVASNDAKSSAHSIQAKAILFQGIKPIHSRSC